MEIKLISLDMFMTLADLDARVPFIWQRILRHKPEQSELERCASLLREGYFSQYLALPQMEDFHTMGEVFEDGFRHAAEKGGYDFDPREATEIFLEEHDLSPLYPDVPATLQKLAAHYTIAVSTDADCSMVQRLLRQVPHRYAFVSETLRCYKTDRQGRFFKTVLRETGYAPEEILHIGDGASDILGASAQGIRTCHLCRKPPDVPGWHDAPADHVIHAFNELEGLLGI